MIHHLLHKATRFVQVSVLKHHSDSFRVINLPSFLKLLYMCGSKAWADSPDAPSLWSFLSTFTWLHMNAVQSNSYKKMYSCPKPSYAPPLSLLPSLLIASFNEKSSIHASQCHLFMGWHFSEIIFLIPMNHRTCEMTPITDICNSHSTLNLIYLCCRWTQS